MGYQESWFYITPQSKFSNMIRACARLGKEGRYERMDTFPTDVVTLKESMGSLPAGVRVLWVCGERCFQNVDTILDRAPPAGPFFDWMEQVNMRALTDIQRAARFFYLVKISFGCDHRTYATSAKAVDNAAAHLEEIKKRLKYVNIENKDFADLISVYDRRSALFYLDLPYVGTESYYTGNFTLDDHRRLKDVLEGLKGRFILSYGDAPLVWEL